MEDLSRIKALLCFVDYCRTEAHELGLSLPTYLLDVARLSLVEEGAHPKEITARTTNEPVHAALMALIQETKAAIE